MEVDFVIGWIFDQDLAQPKTIDLPRIAYSRRGASEEDQLTTNDR